MSSSSANLSAKVYPARDSDLTQSLCILTGVLGRKYLSTTSPLFFIFFAENNNYRESFFVLSSLSSTLSLFHSLSNSSTKGTFLSSSSSNFSSILFLVGMFWVGKRLSIVISFLSCIQSQFSSLGSKGIRFLQGILTIPYLWQCKLNLFLRLIISSRCDLPGVAISLQSLSSELTLPFFLFDSSTRFSQSLLSSFSISFSPYPLTLLTIPLDKIEAILIYKIIRFYRALPPASCPCRICQLVSSSCNP